MHTGSTARRSGGSPVSTCSLERYDVVDARRAQTTCNRDYKGTGPHMQGSKECERARTGTAREGGGGGGEEAATIHCQGAGTSSHGDIMLVSRKSVRGSREALILAMETEAEILLVQEHRIAGPGLPGVQGLSVGKWWHGVRVAAVANSNGRSAGTAVLVRRPVQVMRVGRRVRGPSR